MKKLFFFSFILLINSCQPPVKPSDHTQELHRIFESYAEMLLQMEPIIGTRTGKVNAQGVDDILDVIREIVFDGGPANIRTIFDGLRKKHQDFIDNSLHYIISAKDPLFEEIQNDSIA